MSVTADWRVCLIAELLFPPRCPACDRLLRPEERDDGYCIVCQKKIVRMGDDICLKCGKRIPDTKESLCADCRRKGRAFSWSRGVYLYEEPMKQAMYRFKYSNRRAYARIFAKDAARMYKELIKRAGIELIVPVPMYKGKLKKRGYNQAAVFAEALSRELSIPFDSDAVIRTRDTLPLKEMNEAERAQNLKNAFNIGKSVVKSKHILVVDDIYTTGATLDAVTGTLAASGAEAVYGMCICVGDGL